MSIGAMSEVLVEDCSKCYECGGSSFLLLFDCNVGTCWRSCSTIEWQFSSEDLWVARFFFAAAISQVLEEASFFVFVIVSSNLSFLCITYVYHGS